MFSKCHLYVAYHVRQFRPRQWRSSLGPCSTCLMVARSSGSKCICQKQSPLPSMSQQSPPLEQPQPPQPPSEQPLPPSPTTEDDKPKGIFQRFKDMARKYWHVMLPVHLVTSTLWFGSFYFVANSGVNVPALLESLGFPEWITNKVGSNNSWSSSLVIAYALYKIFTPLRYMVTVGCVTVTIRVLRRLGYEVVSTPKK